MTRYKTFLLLEEGGWEETPGEHDTNSAETAIRRTAKALPPEVLSAGVMIAAVAVSAWHEEHVQLRSVEPRIVLGGGQQMTVEEAIEEGGDDVDPHPGPGVSPEEAVA